MDDHPRRITDEAWDLVNGNREAAYGHPSSDFRGTGRVTAAILERWLESVGLAVYSIDDATAQGLPRDGFPDIPPRIVALNMTGVKLSREAASPKRDNRVDGIGYWICSDRMVEGY